MANRPFCFILGSGASKQSGIPTGGELVQRWLQEIHEMEDHKGLSLEQWTNEKNLEIKGFDLKRAATFYPQVYQRRYRDYSDQGYACLEKAFEGREPSFGYSVLAQLLALTQHRVAITTNFDNLIADALAIYMSTYPLVCGHESLTGFIRPNPRRPIIAKIHRDLLLNPRSTPEEIAVLPDEWSKALKRILAHYTPIVIGYGGNDGSLMGFLESLSEPIEGGIFWCHRQGGTPEERVIKVVTKHRGKFVPILGFDELMLQIQESLQLPQLLPEMRKREAQRIIDYQKQFETLNAAIHVPGKTAADEEAKKPAREAADAAVERLTKEKNWWGWQLKINQEKEPQKKEALFREGLQEFPRSAELTSNFANFTKNILKNHDEAERLYRKALELDPNDADYIGNFANFLTDFRKRHDEAETLYRRALELDPNNANNIGNFAQFMGDVHKDYDEEERLSRRALELDPENANIIGNFAEFMEDVRKNYDEAERLYRRALELDPKNEWISRSFEKFLKTHRSG